VSSRISWNDGVNSIKEKNKQTKTTTNSDTCKKQQQITIHVKKQQQQIAIHVKKQQQIAIHVKKTNNK
jgi:hypothetical protein